MTGMMRDALERSVIAIDDWLQTYAAEICDPARVEEASRRIGEYGTLSYIASVQEQNRAALTAPPALAATPDICPDCSRSVDGPTHAAYCAATPAVEWQDIATAPKSGVIEAKNANDDLFNVWWDDAAFKGFPKNGGILCVPFLTHWRSIAAPPAVGGEREAMIDEFGDTDWTHGMNVLLLIEHGLSEPIAKRVAEQYREKCAGLAAALYAAQPASPLRGRETIRKILNDHFWTGEPGQHGAIEAAASVLASLPEPPALGQPGYAAFRRGEMQASPPEQPAAAGGWPPPFELMKLQARKRGGDFWTDIYPAQLEQMIKQGCDVRAIEGQPTAAPDTGRLADAAIHILNAFRKGLRSRDKQFAITLLEKALSPTAPDKETL